MWAALFEVAKTFLPTLAAKLVELVCSKKAIVTAAGLVGVSMSSDWKTQAATALVTGAFTLGQAAVDAAKHRSTVAGVVQTEADKPKAP